MTFNEYWSELENLKLLPQMAIQELPSSLSPETKKRLMRKQPEETVELIDSAIEEINHGSVESIDCLIKKRL